MSGAPVGQAVSVTVHGKERQLHIKPNVFSDATLSALNRLHKHKQREARAESLQELGDLKSSVPGEIYTRVEEEVIKSFVTREFGGYLDAVDMLRTKEGMAVALHMNSDEVGSYQEAIEVIEGASSVMDLFAALFEAGTEAIEAAKNFSPPSPQKGSPSQSE